MAGGAKRGADCLGEDWKGMAGTASCGKARYGPFGIGRERQEWQGEDW